MNVTVHAFRCLLHTHSGRPVAAAAAQQLVLAEALKPGAVMKWYVDLYKARDRVRHHSRSINCPCHSYLQCLRVHICCKLTDKCTA